MLSSFSDVRHVLGRLALSLALHACEGSTGPELPRSKGDSACLTPQSDPDATDYHVHGTAAHSVDELFDLLEREERLEAGFAALGIENSSIEEAKRLASAQMELCQLDHNEAYERRKIFREALEDGYVRWAEDALQVLNVHNARSYVVFSRNNYDTILPLLRQDSTLRRNLRLLLTLPRECSRDEAAAAFALYGESPEIVGFDIFYPEMKESDDPSWIRQTLSGIWWAHRRKQGSGGETLVLRLHVGEGFEGEPERGRGNVVAYLKALQDLRKEDPTFFEGARVILAHVARIDDVAAAAALLKNLSQQGLAFVVNINPLSNLCYHAVQKLEEIAALSLRQAIEAEGVGPEHVDFRAGSDNVGSLKQNHSILQKLFAGRYNEAEAEARLYEPNLTATSP